MEWGFGRRSYMRLPATCSRRSGAEVIAMTVPVAAGYSLDLITSLRAPWIKVPYSVMRDVGPAVQTLGGLLRITTKQTFVPLSAIATSARLPLATARKHIATLDAQGWVANSGRQRTPRGAPRRTCTLCVTKKTRDAIDRKQEHPDEPLLWGVLPWWACCAGGTVEMPWSARALLSVVMAKLMSLRAVVDREDGKADLTSEDYWESFENLGSLDARFSFTLNDLSSLTGLSRHSIIEAKRLLHRKKIINWQGFRDPKKGDVTDKLLPNPEFYVCVKPAETEGRCYVTFQAA